MESDKTTTTLRQCYDSATTVMSILATETPFDKSERSFERFSFPPLSDSFSDLFPDSFPDVPSFRSLGTRSRRTTSHIVLPDESLHTGSLHTGSLHTGSLHTGSLHTEPAKVPIYGGILHTVYEGVDYYALVQGRHTGKWSFPKGHLQLGETGPECALREIAEETGMDEVDHEQSIGTLFLHYGTYYLYECSGFDPLLPRDQKEIVHAKWMTLEEMRGVSLNADVSQFRKQRCRVLAWSLTQSLSLTQSVA